MFFSPNSISWWRKSVWQGRRAAPFFQVAEDNYRALLSFFAKFPAFTQNDFFIFGESYGGIYVPTLSLRVATGPATFNFKVRFPSWLRLFSDQQHQFLVLFTAWTQKSHIIFMLRSLCFILDFTRAASHRNRNASSTTSRTLIPKTVHFHTFFWKVDNRSKGWTFSHFLPCTLRLWVGWFILVCFSWLMSNICWSVLVMSPVCLDVFFYLFFNESFVRLNRTDIVRNPLKLHLYIYIFFIIAYCCNFAGLWSGKWP